MSLPRLVLPGSTYLITRRCTQRQFLLRPSPLVNQIFAYVVAVAAVRTNIRVHALCVLSNHWHAVVSDPDARLPEFLAETHKYVSKCVNASLGRWENLWASEPPSAVCLEDADDILDKVIYTLCNPVSSYLVERGRSWPGLRADWTTKPAHLRRPEVFFRDGGSMPVAATLELVAPASLAEMYGSRLTRLLRRAVANREVVLRDRAAEKGIRFLGRARVLSQDVYDSPRSAEPRRNLSPRVGALDKWRRIEALRRLDDFVSAYREAWERWKVGGREVVFPPGTYAMRVRHGVT